MGRPRVLSIVPAWMLPPVEEETNATQEAQTAPMFVVPRPKKPLTKEQAEMRLFGNVLGDK